MWSRSREVKVPGSFVRCPYCHDDLHPDEQAWVACRECLARHHHRCWQESGQCATCRSTQFVGHTTRSSWRARVAYAAVALVLVFIGWSVGSAPARLAEEKRQRDEASIEQLGLGRAHLEQDLERLRLESQELSRQAEVARNARRLLEDELRAAKTDGARLVARAAYFLRSNELDKAIDCATRALSDKDVTLLALDLRAQARLAIGTEGQIELAQADATYAVDLAPRSAEAWILRAKVREKLGDTKRALADLDTAVFLGPEKGLDARARLREKLVDIAGAISDLERLVPLTKDPRVELRLELLRHVDRGALAVPARPVNLPATASVSVGFGKWVYALEENGGTYNKLLVLDENHELVKHELPAGACHLELAKGGISMLQDVVAIACFDAATIALYYTGTSEIEKIPLSLPNGAKPRRIVAGAPRGKLWVVCAKGSLSFNDTRFDADLVELDLETKAVQPLVHDAIGHALVVGKTLITQGVLHRSVGTGRPALYDTEKPDDRTGFVRRECEEMWGFGAVRALHRRDREDAIIATNAQGQTRVLSSDAKDTLMLFEGNFVAAQSELIVTAIPRRANGGASKEWILVGHDPNTGLEKWRRVVVFDEPDGGFIDSTYEPHQAQIVRARDGGQELIWRGQRGWHSFQIPVAAGKAPSTRREPITIGRGMRLEFDVPVDAQVEDKKFVLVEGPPGMAIDPKTGCLSWLADVARPKERVIVAVRIERSVVRVLDVELRVVNPPGSVGSQVGR